MYEHKKLPMGLYNSTDIFQVKMNELFNGVRTYIEDLLIITNNSIQHHIKKLDEVLSKLKSAGFKADAEKFFFANNELE